MSEIRYRRLFEGERYVVGPLCANGQYVDINCTFKRGCAMMLDSLGRNVLIVEDEPMLALTLEELVVESGFLVAGVVGRLDAALAIIESGVCDAAILDTNLRAKARAPRRWR